MKKDYFLTLTTTQLSMFLNVLSFKLVAIYFGEDGFAIYNIGRRTISVLCPLLIMGIGISLSRYVAMTECDDVFLRRKLLFNAFYPVFFVCLLVVIASYFLPEKAASLFLGDSSLGLLIKSIAVYAAGITLFGILQSYYRGTMQFFRSNMLNLFSGGIILILCIVIFNESVERMYFMAGTFMIFIATIIYFNSSGNGPLGSKYDAGLMKNHLSYGLPRLPGDISFYLLLMLPSWMANKYYGIAAGGSVAFACTILNIYSSAVSPISFLLLPKASSMFKNGERGELRVLVLKIVIVSVVVSTLGVIVLELSIDEIIKYALGSEYLKTSPLIRIVSYGTIPYTLFICLRSIADAKTSIPVNATICIASLVVMLFWDFMTGRCGGGVETLLRGLVVSLYVLGGLSVFVSFYFLGRKKS